MIFNIIYLVLFGKKFVFFVKIGGVFVIVKVGNIIIEKVIIMIIIFFIVIFLILIVIGMLLIFMENIDFFLDGVE